MSDSSANTNVPLLLLIFAAIYLVFGLISLIVTGVFYPLNCPYTIPYMVLVATALVGTGMMLKMKKMGFFLYLGGGVLSLALFPLMNAWTLYQSDIAFNFLLKNSTGTMIVSSIVNSVFLVVFASYFRQMR